MVNYLYPSLGGSGGGSVVGVTGNSPIQVDNTDPTNPIISITTAFYDVGTGWPYATVAAAIAAAQAVADTTAVIRLNQDITENVALPRGMSLCAELQNGQPIRTLTGSITSDAPFSGSSVITGLRILSNGATITTANAATNIVFTNCTIAQGSDFNILSSSAGSNVIYRQCVFVGSGIATTQGFSIGGGNISMFQCSTLSIASGIFVGITGGSLTANETLMVGTVDHDSGGINFTDTLISVTSGACIDIAAFTSAVLIDCNLSSIDGAVNAIVGSGTINYKNLGFINSQSGVDNTIIMVPYQTAINAIGSAEAWHNFNVNKYEFGIDATAPNPFAWNVPGNTGYRFKVDTTDIISADETQMSVLNIRFKQSQGANVAAANDMTLGSGGNYFVITGNTQINAIAEANWQSGAVIYLKFTGTPTVKHATAGGAGFASFNLDGSVDIVAANNTLLTLLYDGTVWQQVSLKQA